MGQSPPSSNMFQSSLVKKDLANIINAHVVSVSESEENDVSDFFVEANYAYRN